MSTKKSQRWINAVVAEAAKCDQPMPWDRGLRALVRRVGQAAPLRQPRTALSRAS